MLAIPPTYGHWFFHRMPPATGGVKVIGPPVTCDPATVRTGSTRSARTAAQGQGLDELTVRSDGLGRRPIPGSVNRVDTRQGRSRRTRPSVQPGFPLLLLLGGPGAPVQRDEGILAHHQCAPRAQLRREALETGEHGVDDVVGHAHVAGHLAHAVAGGTPDALSHAHDSQHPVQSSADAVDAVAPGPLWPPATSTRPSGSVAVAWAARAVRITGPAVHEPDASVYSSVVARAPTPSRKPPMTSTRPSPDMTAL